jgi:hypothetical protein
MGFTNQDEKLLENIRLHLMHGKGVQWMDFQNWWYEPENSSKNFLDYARYLKRQPKDERTLEGYFCAKVRKAGGLAVKGDCRSVAGFPDRIVFYMGQAWLVELKTLKGVVSPLQLVIHKRLLALGFKVRIIRTRYEVNRFVENMKQGIL